MYSKNDYRYYLEHRLMESDDFLAHHGVKGMKWRHHINRAKEAKEDAQIELAKSVVSTSNNPYLSTRDRESLAIASARKPIARMAKHMTLAEAKGLSEGYSKKKNKKKKLKKIKNTVSKLFEREQPKGKKVGKSGIYVTHDVQIDKKKR